MGFLGASPIGTATAADVLGGFTFSGLVGSGINGTMPEEGSPILNPGASITPGHYSGGSVASYPHGSQTYTATGAFTFTVPTNVTRLFYIVQGAGAGGNASGPTTNGGGAGGTGIGVMSVTPGQQISGSVGVGGAGSGATFGGGAGGNTTFGGITANGGAATPSGGGSLGGTCTGATINMTGNDGGGPYNTSFPGTGCGANSVLGIGGSYTTNPTGNNQNPGGTGAGGGASTTTTYYPGNGGNGAVYIWY